MPIITTRVLLVLLHTAKALCKARASRHPVLLLCYTRACRECSSRGWEIMQRVSGRAFRTYRSGFTLMELLVVLAILALLIAILLPVFHRARRSSQASVCIAHLRQLACATLLYASDYDENFALGFYTKAEGFVTLWGLQRPYTKSDAITLCPLEPMPITISGLERLVGRPLLEPDVAVALVPNWCLFVNAITYPEAPAVSLSQMGYPSDTVVWFDGWLMEGNRARFEPGSSISARHGDAVEPLLGVVVRQSRVDRLQAVALDGHGRGFPARLKPDVRREGSDFVQYDARPIALDGRAVPVWFVQGGVYHGKTSFMGWPSRPDPDTGRMLLRCYHRSFYCDEW
jgi:prepilin-type N-terminal cleavage/methylation domain-containing protein